MFPIYRKYPNNKTYYKVHSHSLLTEIKIMGSTYFINSIEAKIMPDRNLIADIIANENNFLVAIEAGEYNDFLEMCKKQFSLKKY